MFTHNTPVNGWVLIGGSVTTIGKIVTTDTHSVLYRVTPMRLKNNTWSTDTFDVEEWHRTLTAPERVDPYEFDEYDTESWYQSMHIPDACTQVVDAFGRTTRSYDIEKISHEVELFLNDEAHTRS